MNKFCLKTLKATGRLITPKRKMIMKEEPTEPCVFVGNHSGTIGPLNVTYNFPIPHKPWVIDILFDKTVNENYIFHDFFFGRSVKAKKFLRFFSKIVANTIPPMLEYIGVVKASKNVLNMRKTIKDSVDTLQNGESIIVFPESFDSYSPYINVLHWGFTSIATRYYKTTGKLLKFYPMYIPPKQKVILIGEPVQYDETNDPHAERERIATELARRIDELARSLPEHKPRPFMLPAFYQYYPEFVHDHEAYWEFLAQPHSD